jgi:hypothetical protein
MFGTRFVEGQHVVATSDIDGWLGGCRVKKGTRGIVRACRNGWFSRSYQVEFYAGGTITVRGEQVRPAVLGHGEEAWRRYRETRQGIALGLFVFFALPTCIAVAQHYLSGGSTADIVVALPEAILSAAVSLVSVLGLPLCVVLGLVIWLRRRTR